MSAKEIPIMFGLGSVVDGGWGAACWVEMDCKVDIDVWIL
jgi:hypothetical protein